MSVRAAGTGTKSTSVGADAFRSGYTWNSLNTHVKISPTDPLTSAHSLVGVVARAPVKEQKQRHEVELHAASGVQQGGPISPPQRPHLRETFEVHTIEEGWYRTSFVSDLATLERVKLQVIRT